MGRKAKSPWVRGALALVVVGGLLAAFIASPVGAALTKKSVKKIANKVFTQRSDELRDSCPSGTAPLAGACFETSARSAADFFQASDACTVAGRRLPTASELIGLDGSPGFTLTAAGELSSGIDSGLKYIAVVPAGVTPLGIFTPKAFRCVAPLSNG